MKLKKYISTGTLLFACAAMLMVSCSKTELDDMKRIEQNSDIFTPDDDNSSDGFLRGGELGDNGGGGGPTGDPTIGDNEDLGDSGTTSSKNTKPTND